jgi:hypothetical protein
MQIILEHQGILISASLCFEVRYLNFDPEVGYPDIIHYYP